MAGLAENDRVSTIGEGGAKVRLFPRWQRGRLLTRRTTVHLVLFFALLIGPWIDIGDHPAIRFDIPGRRMYLWGLTLFATDGAYLLFLFGSLVFSVFLFTALFGRAWCGWSCPQTVFLESLIRPIERLIDGNVARQKKLHAAPWSPAKLLRRALKHGAFLVVAGAIATTVVAYFLGREGIWEAQRDPWSHPAGTMSFLVLTGLLMFDFSWFREQTCIVVCPYGRFQSVLLDADSLGVGYDERRGEPRGRAKDPNAGDCVDCKACVQVCPTGIDIRKGGQMECIQCMACIDACNGVMTKLHRPEGLIRLTSERALEGKRTRLLRARVVAYAVGLVGVIVAFGWTVSFRAPLELNLGRQPSAPFVTLPDGRVQNAMRLRVSNRGDDPVVVTLGLAEETSLELISPLERLEVPAGEVRHWPFFVAFEPTAGVETLNLRVAAEGAGTETLQIDLMRAEEAT